MARAILEDPFAVVTAIPMAAAGLALAAVAALLQKLLDNGFADRYRKGFPEYQEKGLSKKQFKKELLECACHPTLKFHSGGFDEKIYKELWDLTEKNEEDRVDHATWMVFMGTFFDRDNPIEKLKLQIRCYDKDKDGYLSVKEFGNMFYTDYYCIYQFIRLFFTFPPGTGYIAKFISKEVTIAEGKKIDTDKDGKVSADEIIAYRHGAERSELLAFSDLRRLFSDTLDQVDVEMMKNRTGGKTASVPSSSPNPQLPAPTSSSPAPSTSAAGLGRFSSKLPFGSSNPTAATTAETSPPPMIPPRPGQSSPQGNNQPNSVSVQTSENGSNNPPQQPVQQSFYPSQGLLQPGNPIVLPQYQPTVYQPSSYQPQVQWQGQQGQAGYHQQPQAPVGTYPPQEWHPHAPQYQPLPQPYQSGSAYHPQQYQPQPQPQTYQWQPQTQLEATLPTQTQSQTIQPTGTQVAPSPTLQQSSQPQNHQWQPQTQSQTQTQALQPTSTQGAPSATSTPQQSPQPSQPEQSGLLSSASSKVSSFALKFRG